MEIKNLKKIELHVHLDGSLSINSVKNKLNLDKESVEKLLIANDNCHDLNDYLEKFETPIKMLQTKNNLNEAAAELVDSLFADNVIYAEVRFAPNKHTTNLSLEEVVEAVLEGLKNDKVKVNLLLCMMRGDSFEKNKKIIDLACKYQNRGVVGIDLAGAEKLYKTSDYEELFSYAKNLNIPFTIHAGEADGEESILSAINFGATRIGHGVRSIESEECLRLLKEKNILLEVCPTSNVQTNICSNIKSHPIKKIIDYGISVSINTDNRTVSNTSLNNEYELLTSSFNFSEEDFNRMNKDAIRHAFISDVEKQELINKIRK